MSAMMAMLQTSASSLARTDPTTNAMAPGTSDSSLLSNTGDLLAA